MDNPDVTIPRLTKNEQKVLKKIIEQAKVPEAKP